MTEPLREMGGPTFEKHTHWGACVRRGPDHSRTVLIIDFGVAIDTTGPSMYGLSAIRESKASRAVWPIVVLHTVDHDRSRADATAASSRLARAHCRPQNACWNAPLISC